MKFTRKMHDLYELAQDKKRDALAIDRLLKVGFHKESFSCGWDVGFADGVQHTLDWLRGEAPYPFEGTDGAELEESPSRGDLRPPNAADLAFGRGWLDHLLREDSE